jgi:hypothetical protein
VVRFDPSGSEAHFFDKSTNSLVISLIFGAKELSSELAFIAASTVQYTLPIHEVMDVNPQTLSKMPLRAKRSHRRDRLKEMATLETVTGAFPTITPGPIARLADVSEWGLLRARIEETLKFVKKLDSEENRAGTLQELKSFVMKASKGRTDLKSERSELAASRGGDIAPTLYRFSLKL